MVLFEQEQLIQHHQLAGLPVGSGHVLGDIRQAGGHLLQLGFPAGVVTLRGLCGAQIRIAADEQGESVAHDDDAFIEQVSADVDAHQVESVFFHPFLRVLADLPDAHFQQTGITGSQMARSHHHDRSSGHVLAHFQFAEIVVTLRHPGVGDGGDGAGLPEILYGLQGLQIVGVDAELQHLVIGTVVIAVLLYIAPLAAADDARDPPGAAPQGGGTAAAEAFAAVGYEQTVVLHPQGHLFADLILDLAVADQGDHGLVLLVRLRSDHGDLRIGAEDPVTNALVIGFHPRFHRSELIHFNNLRSIVHALHLHLFSIFFISFR